MKYFICLIILICFSCKFNNKEKITPSETLIFGELPISYSAVSHMAFMEGYYSDNGYEFKLVPMPAGPDIVKSLKSVAEESIEAGSIAITPVVYLAAGGEAPVIVATTLTSNQRVKLVSLSDSKDPQVKDLRNKKVGVVLGTVGEIYLSRLLKSEGMTEKDIIRVNGKPANLTKLLLAGELDAAILWDPFVSIAKRTHAKNLESGLSKLKINISVDTSLYDLAFNIVTTKSKIEDNREELIEMIKDLVAAGNYIENNKLEAQEKLEAWLNLEKGDLTDLMNTTNFQVHLDKRQIGIWLKDEFEWLKSLKPDTQVPNNFDSFIDATLISEVDKTLLR